MEPVSAPRTLSGRYELTHLIARGGMAQVYLAHDRLLDRPVACKVLFPELSVDLAFVERFRREAQAAANLVHPNIVQVFDWGEDDGSYFIVMEYIDGQSLSAMLRQSGRLHPTEAALIAAKVADGLGYAHRRGVVHRDIKPGNVLITHGDEVHVTDFGIARAINTEDDLTQAGSVMGTAAYFSPEQAEGLAVDARSDLYSLGVVLFEMLTGRAPFVGDSPVAVASKHVREVAPTVRELNPSVPPSIEAIVTKAMAKVPAERYQSAEDLRADLLRFVEGRPVLAEAAVGAAAVGAAAIDTGEVAAVGAADPDTSSIPVGGRPYGAVPVRRRRKKWVLPVIIIAVLALLAGGVALWSALRPSNQLTVPDVAGQTVAQATTNLLNDGFTIAGTKKVPSPTVKAGLVAGTTPKAGSHTGRGTPVTIDISAGNTKQVTIPNLVGFSVSSAQAQLSALGLNSQIAYVPSPLPAGTVVNTNPQSGTVVWSGTSVTLNLPVVATPTVPNVIGQTPAMAGAALAGAGFAVGTSSNGCSNSVTTGLISATSPTAGTSAAKGTAVNLVISSGVCQVTVPNVVGQNQGPAISALQAQGFQATNVAYTGSQTCSPSAVVTQTPAAGTSVAYGSTVTLAICGSNATTSTTTTTIPS